MPIKKCTTDSGASGWQYGDQKCHRLRKDAIRQMQAIKISQQKSKSETIDFSNEDLTFEELLEINLENLVNDNTN